MMERRITLLDVAAHAGVSRATASLVLRDTGQLADSTRERVRSSMQTLGYVYNRAAASLRASSTHTVGLIVPDPYNAFMTELTLGLESVLAKHGMLTLTANTFEDVSRQHLVVQALMERRVDGIVVLPALGTRSDFSDDLRAAGVPTVFTTRTVDGATAAYVGIDNVSGGVLAAEHLLGHGCRTFGYLGGLPPVSPRRDRIVGVRRALSRVPGARLVIHRSGQATGQWARRLVSQLLVQGPLPDAVICHNDAVAFGLYRAVRDVAPALVNKVRVIGFDDVDESSLWEPPISSVAANGRQVGSQAARALLRQMNEPLKGEQQILLQPELMVRRSCGCPFDLVD
jgi:LacI family transcriptional regulator